MTAPKEALIILGWALIIGAGLGFLYGALRPLRPRFTTAADLIFLAGALAGWIYWAFGICLGDPRPVGLLAMGLGGLAWEQTAGRWLRPVFRRFWQTIGLFWKFLLLPIEKILYFLKILIAPLMKL